MLKTKKRQEPAVAPSSGINPAFVQIKLSFSMNRKTQTMHCKCRAWTDLFGKLYNFVKQDQQKIMQTNHRDFRSSRQDFEFDDLDNSDAGSLQILHAAGFLYYF